MLFKPPYTFLTTKPQTRLLSKSHPEWLAVLPIVDITAPEVKAIITYTDDSTAELVLASPTLRMGEAQYIDVSYATHDYDAETPAKTIRHIIVRVESEDFADQSAQDFVKYYPYSPKADNNNPDKSDILSIYYHNSYDGLDSIICIGDTASSIETDNLITEKPMDLNYQLGDAQFAVANQTFRETFQVSTGSKPGLEIYALHDLFSLKAAYEYRVISGVPTLIPIIPAGNGIAMPSSRTSIKNLSFSYQYAYRGRAKDRQGI